MHRLWLQSLDQTELLPHEMPNRNCTGAAMVRGREDPAAEPLLQAAAYIFSQRSPGAHDQNPRWWDGLDSNQRHTLLLESALPLNYRPMKLPNQNCAGAAWHGR